MAGKYIMTKQIMAMAPGAPLAPIVPRNIDEVYRLAELCALSGIAPKSFAETDRYKKPLYENDKLVFNIPAITIALLTGMELGVPPMQALQGIAVINGTPCVWGDLALALVRNSGLLGGIEETSGGEGDSYRAICTVKRSDTNEIITREFSIQDAKDADLLGKKGPWQTYPKRMLQMRARSWSLRDAFADVLKGLQIKEEQQDIVDITPEPEKISPPPAPTQEREVSLEKEVFDEEVYLVKIEEAFKDCKTDQELSDLLKAENTNWQDLNKDIVDSIRPLVAELYDDRLRCLKQDDRQIDLDDVLKKKEAL